MLNRGPSLQHVTDSIAKQHEEMTKLECRRNDQMTKSKNVVVAARDSFVIRISLLIRHSDFVIRHYTP